MILSGSSCRTYFLSLLRMNGMTLIWSASSTSFCYLLNNKSSYLNVIKFTLNNLLYFVLNSASVPRYPGISSSNIPHNSNNLFCTGVPDKINL